MNAIVADVVWPAMFLAGRLMALWAIGIGLVIELFFVRWLTGFSWTKSLLADVAMNAASSLVGLFLIPIGGLAWEFTAGLIMYKTLNIGTFNPITWAATFLIAVFINSALETTVLCRAFKQKPFNRFFWWLSLANALSVGVALASIFMYPPRTR
jgi:hypothetical protein